MESPQNRILELNLTKSFYLIFFQVIYYEHAQHQHHYDEHGGGGDDFGGGGYWKRTNDPYTYNNGYDIIHDGKA